MADTLRWEIRRQDSKSPIAWGTAETTKACEKAIAATMKRDLFMLNPERLVCEIGTVK